MILKGSQRAGGLQLAAHLLNDIENDHVTLHEVRGFIANTLPEAMKEAYAISRGTRCKQFLFSLSLSPPQTESVSVDVFEVAISQVEKRMGLEGQPRAIVFHEKEGRRHAHCVWSRIDANSMTAINLPHYKLKLRDVSRQLYLENKWRMPIGLMNSAERNPLNFTRAEWQQAKRIGRDPREIKEIFKECWAVSDGLPAFRNALEARGYYLAQGDRRGYIAIDWHGEIYAIARWTDQKTRDIKAKLGEADRLPPLVHVKKHVEDLIEQKTEALRLELRREFQNVKSGVLEKRAQLIRVQRAAREKLVKEQAERHIAETKIRSERFRKGLIGLWDWVTGRKAEIRKFNEMELAASQKRDSTERQQMIDTQLKERQQLQQQMQAARHFYIDEEKTLHWDFSKSQTELSERDRKKRSLRMQLN